MNITRKENETEEQFLWRIGQLKDSGVLDMSWEEIASVMNQEFRDDVSEYRSEAAYRKPYQQAKRFFDSGIFNSYDTAYLERLRDEKQEIRKEKQKLYDERSSLGKMLREQGRAEYMTEIVQRVVEEHRSERFEYKANRDSKCVCCSSAFQAECCEFEPRLLLHAKMIYHYLLLQAGAFGSKQIWIEEGMWKNNTFRGYWLPTESSNRRSPVNPMMPMPETLLARVNNIVESIGGTITASQESVFDALYRLDDELQNGCNDLIVYIDPPYMNTTGYKEGFNIYNLINAIWNEVPIYVSEGVQMDGAKETYLLSSGRKKGNISGNVKKNPVEEWLNKF